MKKSNKGFTLVELIIVIAILAIIMLIAIPNFSGIQQRMQVRADKSTAAQIGKAIRIWMTEKSSDGDDTSIATMPVIKVDPDDGTLSFSEDLKHYENLAGIKDYISVDNEPSSLSIEDSKAKSATQYYAPVLAGTDRSSKIMIVIQGTGDASATDAGKWTLAYNADGDDANTEKDDAFGVDYDGIGPGIAYIEP